MKHLSRQLSCLTVAALFGIPLLFPSSLLAAISGSLTGSDLVANGGFEADASGFPTLETAPLTDWTPGEVLGSGGPNQNKVDGLNSTSPYGLAPHGGVIVAAFNSTTNTVTDGGFATLTQSLATAVGPMYDLTFWLANPIQDSTDFRNVFSVSWNGSLLSLSSPSLTETAMGSQMYVVKPDTTWFQVTVTGLTVTGTSTNLVFSGRNSDYATLLDDVSVVPEPTTLIMLGAGMLLMGLIRSRRTRAT